MREDTSVVVSHPEGGTLLGNPRKLTHLTESSLVSHMKPVLHLHEDLQVLRQEGGGA